MWVIPRYRDQAMSPMDLSDYFLQPTSINNKKKISYHVYTLELQFFLLKFLENCCFYKKKYNQVVPFSIKILQKIVNSNRHGSNFACTLKKHPSTYFLCVSSKKKVLFFPKNRKKISREGSSNLAIDAKRQF
jgi:hypothetical protein